jgi:release factor glutamine methyltransferase
LTRDAAVALTAAGIDNARFEARLLMARASGRSVERLIAESNEPAPAASAEALRALTARRVRREPMAYILGEREFWGLPFKVTPAVLVPRPDSETLIETALVLMPERERPRRVLDLGVGSGCLLLSLLHEWPNATGIGIDLSRDALAIARNNADALGLGARTTWREGDWREPGWLEGLAGPFDLIVSNPPYIASSTIDGLMPEVARFEPRLALDGGADGLDAYRALAVGSHKLVIGGGRLLVEVGEGQAIEVAGLLASAGWHGQRLWRDLAGIERVVSVHH